MAILTMNKGLLIIIIVIITISILLFLINYFLLKKPQIPDEDEEEIFQKAQTLFGEGKYQETVEKYKKLINEYPDSNLIDDALFSLGFCYKNLNDSGQALVSFERVIFDYPDSKHVPTALFEAANIYLEKNNSEKAQEYLTKINDYSDTGKITERANELNSKVSASLLFEQGQILFGEGKYEEALVKYQGFIDTYPGAGLTDQVLVSMAFCYERLVDKEQALIFFERTFNEYPESVYAPDALYHAALLYKLKNNNEKMKEYCGRIITQYPNTREWLIEKARQCLE